MKILAIESSCDETAAAVVEDGRRLLSNVVNTQIDIHAEYGGVVPEVAARSHIEVVNPAINQALTSAYCNWDDIDAIAVTYAPGLVGSLLIGTLAARTLAVIHNKPLYPIHHVEAHVYANFIVEKRESEANATASGHPQPQSIPSQNLTEHLQPQSEANPTASEHLQPEILPAENRQNSGAKPLTRSTDSLVELILPSSQPTFPMLALIVSGGHSQLVLFRDHGDYELLGQTQDDAVGEAFDKVAKIVGLPYPGGPSVSRAALQGDPYKYQLPKAKLDNPYNFSFSGLKTAVLRAVQREVGVDFTFPSHELPHRLNDQQRADFAASFQRIAIETLVDKAERAFKDHSPASVVIAGGVAANQELRRQLSERIPVTINYAPMQLCTDNAAMIGTLAYYYAQKNAPTDPYSLEVVPSLSMTKTAWV